MKTTTSTFKVGQYGDAIVANLTEDGVRQVAISFLPALSEIWCQIVDAGVVKEQWHVSAPVGDIVPENADAIRHACIFLLHCVDVDPIELSTETIAEALTK